MKPASAHGDPSHQAIIDRLEAVIRENTRDLIGHFQQGQLHQDKRMDTLEKDVSSLKDDVGTLKDDMKTVKQDIGLMKNAIVELADNERHLRNLVHHLQREGIKISDVEVFAT